MKYLGSVCLMISSISLGVRLCKLLLKKRDTCRQLVIFCDLLITDLNYKMTPAPDLLCKILDDKRLNNLEFIKDYDFNKNTKINSVLTEVENNELSYFLESFGKSDIYSQIKSVENFREFIKKSENKYSQCYVKNSKLYVACAFFSSVLIMIVMI